MSLEERSPSILLPPNYPRDSRFYERNTPAEWLAVFERDHVLEAFSHIPLLSGELTKDDIDKINNVLTALTFGKHHVPYILCMQADETRQNWESIRIIGDTYFDRGKEELISKPYFHNLTGDPVANVLAARTNLNMLVEHEVMRRTPGGGVSISFADDAINCIPRAVAIAGTEWATTAIGRLKEGNYLPLVSYNGGMKNGR